jgi:arylsulfatase A-like enzyme
VTRARARVGTVPLGWLLCLTLTACRHRPPEGTALVEAGPATPVPSAASSRAQVAISPIDDVTHACVFGYEGTVLDFGDPNLEAHFGPKLGPPPIEVIEREGSTWARIRAKTLSVDFYVAPPFDDDARAHAGGQSFLEAHVRGGAAKTVAFYVNGKLVGTSTLTKNVARVVSWKAPSAETPVGSNQLLLRFWGGPKAGTEPQAEVDWVHLGQGEPSPMYPVSLRGESKVSATILEKAQRALALRGGGYVRCPGWIPSGGQFEASLGLSGPGPADAEVRLVRDRMPPVTIGTAHLEGPDREGKAVSFPIPDLGDKAGALGAIELVATRSPANTRVLFGEPKVTISIPPPAPRSPPARGVVLVVMGSVATRSLSLYGGKLPVPELSRVAERGIVFDANRATTGLENGSFASMITGLSAREHGVDDGDARLPGALTTIADAARQAGIPTALFTANPTAGSVFGFNRGWSTFETQGPLESLPSVHVLDRAGAFIAEHKAERFLVVVYARGGHPPWDIPADDVKSLDPPKYTGGLDPKHAGELLGRPGGHGLSEDDRVRAWAMYDYALQAQDAALGHLLSAIASAGRGADTAVVVTGDVGVDGKVPAAQPGSLDDAVLWTPLVIGLPGGELAGTHVVSATTGLDVGRSILGLLGLDAPDSFGGVDLVDLAAHRTAPFARPLLSSQGERFALRWGTFVEMGQREREGRLCDLSLEPTCISDVSGTYPLAASLLHASAFDLLVTRKGHPPPREPAAIDKETHDALQAWGR